ncbi:MAG: ATP-binding protein [Anaerolineae bacterium]
MDTLPTDIVFGHQWAIKLLNHAIASETLPQSLLVTGAPQLGKATLARALAMALTCQDTPKPCGRCSACQKIQSGNHPDVTILDTPGNGPPESLKIEQIRALQKDLSLRPFESRHKIAILCDFERATASAANALLKTLEEPPPSVNLILTAQTVNRLLPTIVSRCQIIGLRPVAAQTVSHMLQQKFGAPPSKADLLGRLARGRPGWAAAALANPQILSRRTQYLEDLLNLTGQGYHSRLAYAEALAKGNRPPAEAFELWLLWWRDVLLLRLNAGANIVNLDFSEKARSVAEKLSPAQILTAVKHTCAALKNLEFNVNRRLNAEVLLLNLPYLKHTGQN